MTDKQLDIATISATTVVDIVLGMAICKSDMNPFAKLFTVAAVLNDQPRVVATTKRLFRQWYPKPEES